MRNLSESILYNIHKSKDINIRHLKESEDTNDFLSKKLETICNKIRTSR